MGLSVRRPGADHYVDYLLGVIAEQGLMVATYSEKFARKVGLKHMFSQV